MKIDPLSSTSLTRDHEASHASLRNVFLVATSVLVLITFCLISVAISLRVYSKNRPMQPMEALGILIAPDNQPLTHLPAPNLELDDGHSDLMALNQRQVEELNSNGWLDHTHGIVHLSIEQAMSLMIERGLSVRTNQQDPPSTATLRPGQERTSP